MREELASLLLQLSALLLLPPKPEAALGWCDSVSSQRLWMLLQGSACCWPFLRSRPWTRCCWAQTSRMTSCSQYCTPWRGSHRVISFICYMLWSTDDYDAILKCWCHCKNWVYGVEKRKWTFFGLGYRFRALNQKGALEFNSAPYFRKRRDRNPRRSTCFSMLQHPVSGRIKTGLHREWIASGVVSETGGGGEASPVPMSVFFLALHFILVLCCFTVQDGDC